MHDKNVFSYLKNDLPSSIVVFFVALPLCLGIALASGAPLFSGLIAGIVGGIVVGALSGSSIGVSGPAAGLAAIVFLAINDFADTYGGYNEGFKVFLVAVVLGGIIQLIFGILRFGIIGYFFPSSVIRGMLTGIGIIIILKQIPHFFGYDSDPEGDFAFNQVDGGNTFSGILDAFGNISIGATLIGFISLAILLLWSNVLSKKGKFFQLVQGPLVAVVVGIVYYILTASNETFGISTDHLVSVPVPDNFDSFLGQFSFPAFSAIGDPAVWITAFTLALVASLETLLCVEATDKLDPHKNITPTNRELLAQGTGNIVSGLIGGLPITQVIVRSSANIQSGGRTKMSAIIHGFFLLFAVVLIPTLLNKIPLSVLAAVLFIVGWKLANPALFKKIYNQGWMQFIPFMVTVIGIVFTDLLVGIGLGLAVGIFIILIKSYQNSHFLHKEDPDVDHKNVKMTLAEEVTFFNKAAISRELDNLPMHSNLELDLRNTLYLDHDIIEILEDFTIQAEEKHINVKLLYSGGTVENPSSYVELLKKTA